MKSWPDPPPPVSRDDYIERRLLKSRTRYNLIKIIAQMDLVPALTSQLSPFPSPLPLSLFLRSPPHPTVFLPSSTTSSPPLPPSLAPSVPPLLSVLAFDLLPSLYSSCHPSPLRPHFLRPSLHSHSSILNSLGCLVSLCFLALSFPMAGFFGFYHVRIFP